MKSIKLLTRLEVDGLEDNGVVILFQKKIPHPFRVRNDKKLLLITVVRHMPHHNVYTKPPCHSERSEESPANTVQVIWEQSRLKLLNFLQTR